METALLKLKDVPVRFKSLIQSEADGHRRTLTQEAIVLLEEAVLARSSSQSQTRDEIDHILDSHHKLPTKDQRPMQDIVEYDELGLTK
jgi:hypothetical protein